MGRLVSVGGGELSAVWPQLRERVAGISSGDGWLPEDVYCTLRAGGASLHLIEVDGVEVGFLVLRVIPDFDGARLHLWLLHAESDIDVMAEFSDELDAMARAVQATRLTFSTTRRGWERVAPRYAFTVRETVFERKVKT